MTGNATTQRRPDRLDTLLLGSPRAIVDTGTGAVVQEMEFDAWGVVLRDTNLGFQPFGFAGGLWDRDTGLVRFGARDYDSSAGHWQSGDRLGLTAGMNRNEYVASDPINTVDQTGNDICVYNQGIHTGVLVDLACVPPSTNPSERAVERFDYTCAWWSGAHNMAVQAMCLLLAPGKMDTFILPLSRGLKTAGSYTCYHTSCENSATALDEARSNASSPGMYSGCVNSCKNFSSNIQRVACGMVPSLGFFDWFLPNACEPYHPVCR